jgi:tripartite-type tricarboxylate transporter receptor subunit TctC
MKKSLAAHVAAVVLALALMSPDAQAQNYPTRHITVVVPFSPGSPADTITRIVGASLAKSLGQPIVNENVTGSGGVTGTKRAASAAPDGYTMLMASSGTHAGAPTLYANLGFDPVESFEQIGLVGSTYVLLVGRPQLPASNLQDFVAYLLANEKTVTEGHAGVGSISHVACTYLHSLLGIKPTRVPYRASSDATVALLSGNVDYLCNQYINVSEQVREGKLKAFAIASERRLALLPDVPTTAEGGLAKFKVDVWYALQFPKGTPDIIVERMNKALTEALDDPDVRKKLADLGVDVAPSERRASGWLRTFIKSEIEFWRPLLQDSAQEAK